LPFPGRPIGHEKAQEQEEKIASAAFTNITELRWIGAFIPIDNVVAMKTTD